MRTSVSHHLIFHLIFNLFTPVSCSYSTSTYQPIYSSWKSEWATYQPRHSSWKSEWSTTTSGLFSKNLYFTSTYQTRQSSWNSKWPTSSSSSKTTQETIRPEYTADKTTTTDFVKIDEHDNETLFSNENETSVSTTKTYEMASQTYQSAVMGDKQPTKSQTSVPFEPNVTSTETVMDKLFEMDSCALFSTCEHVTNLSFQFCQCDVLCSMYKDCCADFQNASKNAAVDSIECTQYSTDKRRDGIFAIIRCPDDVNETDEINLKCVSTDILTVGPMVIDDDGFVYRNKFCAECHNKTRLHPFTVRVSNVPSYYLDTRVNKTSVFKLQEILLSIKLFAANERPVLEQIPPTKYNVRRCIQFTPGQVACSDFYTSPVLIGIELYRNQFCYQAESNNYRCLGSQYVKNDFQEDFHGVYALSVIFAFGSITRDCINQMPNTGPGQLLDFSAGLFMLADSGYPQLAPLIIPFKNAEIFRQGKLEKCTRRKGQGICLNQEMYREYRFNSRFLLTANAELSELQLRQMLLVFLWTLPSEIMINNFKTSPADIFNSTMHVGFIMQLVIQRLMDGTQMLAYKTMIENIQCQIVVHRPLAEPIEINIEKTKIIHSDEKPMMRIIKYNFVSDNVARSENINIPVKKQDKACLQTTMTGALNGNTSLVIYHVQCIEEFVYRTLNENDNMKIILTYTGMGISVLALTASLIIFRRLGMHTSIPGSNAENLSVSLLLSNILFLCGIGANDYQNVCYIVGVSLHYLWLSVFSFMSISMVNMLNDLRKMTLNTAVPHTSKTKTKLTILGLFLPVVFVGPSVILDYIKINRFNFQYDGSICFPIGYPAAVIFVSAPIGLSVLINLACFIGIAVVLTKHSIASKNIRKSSSYQNVFVYARISVVTGLFWTTGLLGIVMPSEAVEYAFITCCSLQGFLVAFCNLTTKRVIRQIKDHLTDSQD